MPSDSISATFNGKLLAQASASDLTKVEGNWYFKQAALVDPAHFTESKTHTHCPWKGDASYYNYHTDDGAVVNDIAWYYPNPKTGAEDVAGRVAFYVGRVAGLVVE